MSTFIQNNLILLSFTKDISHRAATNDFFIDKFHDLSVTHLVIKMAKAL